MPHALGAPVEEAHVDVAEVVLRELAREALEADHRPQPLGPQLLDQRVQGALAAGVALELRAAEQLDGEHVRLGRKLAD